MHTTLLNKYSGAGNDFIVIDGRTADVSAYRQESIIQELCDRKTGFLAADGRIGADGLMILSEEKGYDFRMEYFNSDGSGGMMCGNGGRCIAAFADSLGIVPEKGNVLRFVASDGEHTAEILPCSLTPKGNGRIWTIKLRMIDVHTFYPALDGYFLDTGTRHFVRHVEDVEKVDIEVEGKAARMDPAFAPIGANANFVSPWKDGSLKIRTFEKGVEAETLACGTGITASAIASYLKGIAPTSQREGILHYDLQARTDMLSVDFRPSLDEGELFFTEVYLTGPAEEIL